MLAKAMRKVTTKLDRRIHVHVPAGAVPKLLAAQRAGLSTVFIPRRNEPDRDDVPAEVLEALEVKPMTDVATSWPRLWRRSPPRPDSPPPRADAESHQPPVKHATLRLLGVWTPLRGEAVKVNAHKGMRKAVGFEHAEYRPAFGAPRP